MFRLLVVGLLSLSLMACASLKATATKSELAQGKRFYNDGLYKRAMHQLLPLAVDGNAEAQYAIGYMYYYGFGVAQDTDTGEFWIGLSAKQRYEPAMRAYATVAREDKIERRETIERKEIAERERALESEREKLKHYHPKIRYSDIKKMD